VGLSHQTEREATRPEPSEPNLSTDPSIVEPESNRVSSDLRPL
jgi:hypothetical protein